MMMMIKMMPVSGQSLDPSTQTQALETAQSVKDVQEGGGYTDSDTGVAEGKIGRKKTRREGRRTTNLGPSCRCWGWRGRWLVRWRRGVRWGVEPGN